MAMRPLRFELRRGDWFDPAVDEPRKPRFAGWKRLLIIAVTIVAVVSIYRRLDPAAFVATLQRLRWPWLAGSITFYGLVILAAVGRWHLALRLTDSVVHFGVSARTVVIAHFFTITFLGAGVGDLAKGILYSRWYRFSFPVIFAAAKLDRFMGTIGAGLLWAFMLGWGFSSGAFSREALETVRIPTVWKWVGLLLLLVGGVLLLCQNRKFKEGFLSFWLALVQGVKRMVRQPGLGGEGILLGLLVQGGLSFTLAVNLAAIAGGPLDWPKLLWLFPVIQVLSTLPVTVAGLGLREVAAMTLLGMYGVPKEEAAASALLTLLVGLVWAAIGGLVLWRESGLRKHRTTPLEHRTISVVIPALNEAEELPVTLARLRAVPEVTQIIVVDGGSTDGTVAIAEAAGCEVLSTRAGRGRQMRLGAQKASGDVVLMVHADTWLPSHAGVAVLNCLRDPMVVGGGFWKVFREYPHPLLYGSRWKCLVRLLVGRRIAGDQGLFVRRDVLESIGGVPDMELMEEFRLCEQLRRVGRLALANETISTSARRFARHGTLRTYWKMWYVTQRYRLGTPPAELKKMYEQ